MLKSLSREGATAQRKNFPSRAYFASLRLCEIFFFLLLISNPVLCQTKTDPFDPDGSFWLHEEAPPNEFKDFGGINLNAKRSRRLPSQGLQLTDGTNIRFKSLIVKRNNFTFTTVSRRGVTYSFAGRFLKGGVFGAGDLDDETPVLEGTLTKYQAGKKVAEAKLRFVYFGGT